MIAFADDVSGITVSFEFFPPKGEARGELLAHHPQARDGEAAASSPSPMARAAPRVTARSNTVRRIAAETTLKPAAHLTCVGASKAEVNAVVKDFAAAGVRHIVALRGDPPGGVGTRFVPHPDGYRNAADLVRGIRELGDFEISVSAYPERHPESVSIEEDLAFMADKAEHGATPRHLAVLLPQRLLPAGCRDRIAARGIDIELVPGILPITSFARVSEFAAKCGAHVPPALATRFARPRRGPRNPQPRGRHGRRRTGGCAAPRGREALPLLHAEPRRPRLRHLPRAGPRRRRRRRRSTRPACRRSCLSGIRPRLPSQHHISLRAHTFCTASFASTASYMRFRFGCVANSSPTSGAQLHSMAA